MGKDCDVNQKTRTRSILFDLDGTLANSTDALVETYMEFLASFGKVGSEEEFLVCNGPGIEEIVEILRKAHALPGDSSSLTANYMGLLASNYEKRVDLNPGAMNLLSWLADRDVRLALVTSAPLRLVESILRRNSVQNFFDTVVAREHVESPKPAPDCYILAAERLGADSSIAIEDSVNGVLAAVRAGIRVIGLSSTSHHSLSQSGAIATVPSLEKAQEWLSERWNDVEFWNEMSKGDSDQIDQNSTTLH